LSIGVRRRHLQIRVARLNPLDHRALIHVARNDCSQFHGDRAIVESQLRLPLRLVRAVAVEAVLGKNGPNVAVKAYRLVGDSRGATH
jgi:hypothetical protein